MRAERRDGDRGLDRDALIIEHVSWARRLSHQLAPHVAPDDVEGVALEALVEAAGRWSPTGGASFTTFARLIIKGRIKDAKRGEDMASRHERDREAAGGRPAPVRRLTPGPLPMLPVAASQEDVVGARRALERLAAVLPSKLLRVVQLRAQGWKFHEIAREVGKSEVRVCQMLHEAWEYAD